MGKAVVREFIDAASASGRQYQEMLASAMVPGTVLVRTLDRLGRNQREILTVAWAL